MDNCGPHFSNPMTQILVLLIRKILYKVLTGTNFCQTILPVFLTVGLYTVLLPFHFIRLSVLTYAFSNLGLSIWNSLTQSFPLHPSQTNIKWPTAANGMSIQLMCNLQFHLLSVFVYSSRTAFPVAYLWCIILSTIMYLAVPIIFSFYWLLYIVVVCTLLHFIVFV